jgi:hypothetical protein
MFPLWFALLGGSFVFLDVGPSIMFLIFPVFLVLWFIYDWQGFSFNIPITSGCWPCRPGPSEPSPTGHWPSPPTKRDGTSFAHLFVVFRLGRTFYYFIQMYKYSVVESLSSHRSVATNFDPFNLNPKNDFLYQAWRQNPK